MYDSIQHKNSEPIGVTTRKTKTLKVRGVRQSSADEGYPHQFVYPVQMETANVPDELETLFRGWDHEHPVLIAAPTGTGKSTFIIDRLLPFVKEQGGRLLIVSNRVALNTQYKMQVLKRNSHPALKHLTPLGIQEAMEFDDLPVTFCSYQGLPGLLKREEKIFTHAVFDEAHFFCSDSLFARDTGWLLSKIPIKFREAVRVYMTATPWAVENMIAEEEQKLKPSIAARLGIASYRPVNLNPRQLLTYRFPTVKRNYLLHALLPTVRDDPCQGLPDLIKASPEGEKWLIFVDSKAYGKQLAKLLDDADYLDSDGKTGSVWDELTTNERFPKRILITTPVADCGINIADNAVKHVVIFSVDHVQFIQELGRKRLKKGERINLYVPEPSAEHLSRLERHNDQLLRALHQFETMQIEHYLQRLDEWYGESAELRHLIPIDGGGRLHINRCAEQAVRQRGLLYQKLRDLQQAGCKYPFIASVCQWLDLPESALDDTVAHTGEAELLKFLEEHCEMSLKSKEEQDAFSTKFKKYREKIYGSRQKDNRGRPIWGPRIIQGEFEELHLPFTLDSSKGEWVIKRKQV